MNYGANQLAHTAVAVVVVMFISYFKRSGFSFLAHDSAPRTRPTINRSPWSSLLLLFFFFLIRLYSENIIYVYYNWIITIRVHGRLAHQHSSRRVMNRCERAPRTRRRRPIRLNNNNTLVKRKLNNNKKKYQLFRPFYVL